MMIYNPFRKLIISEIKCLELINYEQNDII